MDILRSDTLGTYVHLRPGIAESMQYNDAARINIYYTAETLAVVAEYGTHGQFVARRKGKAIGFELILGELPYLTMVLMALDLTPAEARELKAIWPEVLFGHMYNVVEA